MGHARNTDRDVAPRQRLLLANGRGARKGRGDDV